MVTGLKLTAVVAAAISIGADVHAQQQPGPTVLTAHALKGGVYWVGGGISNAGFIVGDKGVVVIDAQRSVEAGQLQLAEIAKVTPKPVDAAIITHGDPDHICGLPAFPAGIQVIAQENTRAVIRAAIDDRSGGPVYTAMYKALETHMPTVTIASTQDMVIDGVKMELMHLGQAHTGSDLAIYLPEQKIVFGGDIILTAFQYPVIHHAGSSLGWIQSMKAMLALDADTYVPGHGPIISKAMLQAQVEKVERRRADIKALVEQNKSLAEVNQALNEPANPMPFPSFVESTYLELTKGYPPVEAPWHDLVKK